MSNFWIDVENAAGIKQGDGPIISAEYWESVVRLDRAGTFSFSMPASDNRAAIVQPKLVARCYARVQDNVTEIGAGIIDKITLTIGAQGQTMLVVSGDDLLRELTWRSVGFLELTDGAGNGVTNALYQVMQCAPGWSLSYYPSTENNVYAKFAGETVLSALIKIAADKGEHFRIGTGRSVAWLRKDLTSSGIRAIQGGEPTAIDGNKDVCIVVNLQEERDTYQICSRIYPYGSGVGDARLTLAATSMTAPMGYTLDKANNYLMKNNTEESYGRIEQYMSFKNIAPISNTDADLQAAANKLFGAALTYLEKHKQPEKFYTMEVAKVDRLIHPGETVRVVVKKIVDEYDVVDIDADLYVLEVRNRIDGSGIRTTGMQVATVDRWNESDDALIVSSMDETRVMESYPQLNACSYYETFYDAIDGTTNLEFPVMLGAEVVNVNEVRLFFKLAPLESTAKSVVAQSSTSSSGGGSTVTSTSGGSSTQTSSSAGQSTPTTTSGDSYHSHAIALQSGDSGGAVYHQGGRLYTAGGGTVAANFTNISHTHTVSVPSHNHSVTIPSHTHNATIASHTHTLTPSVSMEYGVYRDTTSYVPSLSEITVQIGYATVYPVISDFSSEWYEVDLTAHVSNAQTFRPISNVNTIRISCLDGKRAHVFGKVRVRTVIQAIAVL